MLDLVEVALGQAELVAHAVDVVLDDLEVFDGEEVVVDVVLVAVFELGLDELLRLLLPLFHLVAERRRRVLSCFLLFICE